MIHDDLVNYLAYYYVSGYFNDIHLTGHSSSLIKGANGKYKYIIRSCFND